MMPISASSIIKASTCTISSRAWSIFRCILFHQLANFGAAVGRKAGLVVCQSGDVKAVSLSIGIIGGTPDSV